MLTDSASVNAVATDGIQGSFVFEDAKVPTTPDLLSTDSSVRALRDYILSDMTAIWVYTHEEDRLLEIIKRYIIGYRTDRQGNECDKIKRDKNMFVWSYTRGLIAINPENPSIIPSGPEANAITDEHMQAAGGDAVLALCNFITEQGLSEERANCPNIYVLEDMDRILSRNVVMTRKFRDMMYDLRAVGGTHIIFSSTTMDIPTELEKNFGVVDLQPPGEDEIRFFLHSTLFNIAGWMKKEVMKNQAQFPDEEFTLKSLFERSNLSIDPYTMEEQAAIIRSAKGLTMSEILATFNFSLSQSRRVVPEIVKAEKRQIIQKNKCLEFFEPQDQLSHVGGMDQLKIYLKQRSLGFTDAARKFGAKEPRGILLLGISGCGKSLVAKAVSNYWKLPLVRLDFGKIMGNLVGSSEENMRSALKTISSIAPCVCWIDEIEKNASGMGSSNVSDGGTFARVMSTFLTWMQERNSPVFVVATANNVVNQEHGDALPPELTRAGRFDDIFFVDLPSVSEREEIFRIHLEKIGRDPANFDLSRLAKIRYADPSSTSKKYDYSGAEIEQALQDAVFEVLAKPGKHEINGKGDITEEDINTALLKKIPLSKSRSRIVEGMRNWAKTNALFATSETLAKRKSKPRRGGKVESLLERADNKRTEGDTK